jgi:uncharacterized repeat protein (TIGR03803 family)
MEGARQRIPGKSREINKALVPLAFGLLLLLPSFAFAQTFTVLHTFHQLDGANPLGGLIQDSSGKLYSTTEFGGTQDSGTVFRLSGGTTFTLLYSFNGDPDGYRPDSKLIHDSSGDLYGVTAQGGLQCFDFYHCGTFFKVDTNGIETVLHMFAGAPNDGSFPSGVVRDSNGNFYVTTGVGGAHDHGAVIKIDAAGNETILDSFKGGWDGYSPLGMVRDSAGNLYGLTVGGGGSSACSLPGFWTNGCGTIWKLTNSNGTWTKISLHRFKLTDGATPQGTLGRDSNGNLYGATRFGGSGPCSGGCGTVFKLTPAGKLIVLNNFLNKAKGYYPYSGVVRDSASNLYGTSAYGGNTSCLGGAGCGTVFKLDPAGNKTILHKFTGGSDGFNPEAQLLLNESTHTLYGSTYLGGDQNCSTQRGGGPGCGVVFKIKYP